MSSHAISLTQACRLEGDDNNAGTGDELRVEAAHSMQARIGIEDDGPRSYRPNLFDR
jgi:hypothetical protein